MIYYPVCVIKRSCGILAKMFTTGRMVILRKANCLWLMVMLSLAVFMFSGCGGSKDSSDSETENTDIPNNSPDTYNTESVLQGAWVVVDQEIIIDAVYSGDVELSLYLVTASMDFSSTDITGTSGTSTVSIHEIWRTSLSDSLPEAEIIPINFDSQFVNMFKSGADKWRCEMSDTYKNVFNVEVLAKNLIQVTAHKVTAITSGTYSGYQLEYETTLTFRKKAK